MSSTLPEWDDISTESLANRLRPNLTPSPPSQKTFNSSVFSPARIPQQKQLNMESKVNNDNGKENHKLDSTMSSLQAEKSSNSIKPSAFDEFAYREILLNVSDSNKTLAEYMIRLNEYVTSEADLDPKNISVIHNQIYRQKYSIDDTSNKQLLARLPREATILQNSCDQITNEFNTLMNRLIECFSIRKDLYNSQIKKTREHCNLAIRQASQAERLDAGATLQQLKEKYEKYHIEHTAELQKSLAEALSSKETLEKQLNKEMDAHRHYQHIKENFIAEKDNAVKEAIRELHEEFAIEKARSDEAMKIDINRIRDEAARQVDAVSKQYEIQLEIQRKHLEEVKILLTDERARVEKEVIQQREIILDLQNQAVLEREKAVLKLKDEARKHEREINQLHTENLQEQAKLKAELQQIVQRLKEEECKRIKDIEVSAVRDRETQSLSLSLQAERLEEKHKAEVRKLQAQWDIEKEEEISRIKIIHEQEIKRLLHDINKLEKDQKRLGSPQVLRNRVSTVASDTSSDFIKSISEPVLENKYNNVLDRQAKKDLAFDASSIKPNPTSRWAKLKDSIEQQESFLGRSSIKKQVTEVTRAVPNTLLLDEAFETAKFTTTERNIASNARRVGDYMDQLQQYLEKESPLTSKAFSSPSSRANVVSESKYADSDSSHSDDSKYGNSRESSSMFGSSAVFDVSS